MKGFLGCVLLYNSLTLVQSGSLSRRWTASIKVDASKQYQVVDGWGCAEAFQRAEDVLGKEGLSYANQQYVLDLLFDLDKGAGFTILRNGIGSSNSSMSNFMNSIEPYAPMPDKPSSTPHYVWDHYNSGQFPLAQEAKRRGVPYVYGDAWSAPGFMKTNHDDANGGYICGVPNATCSTGDWRKAYADYLIQFVDFYNQSSIDVTHLGFLNEPSFESNYASMQSNGTQAADFIRILGEAIKEKGMNVELVCCDDYGWDQQAALLPGLQAKGPDGKSAQDYLSVITGHGYASPPTYPLDTPLRTWMTEWGDLSGQYTPYTFWSAANGPGEGLTWANHIQVAFRDAGVSGFLYWIGAENATANSALISLINDNVVPSKRFWSFAQFSKNVRPGAHRIEATVSTSDLGVTAFQNTNGNVAIQILNNATSSYSTSVTVRGANCSWFTTYLTDNENDLEQGQSVEVQPGGTISIIVPAKSLTSLVS